MAVRLLCPLSYTEKAGNVCRVCVSIIMTWGGCAAQRGVLRELEERAAEADGACFGSSCGTPRRAVWCGVLIVRTFRDEWMCPPKS